MGAGSIAVVAFHTLMTHKKPVSGATIRVRRNGA